MAETSFMQRNMVTAEARMKDIFKTLLNPGHVKHGTQLVTVHGEHVPGKKTYASAIKFILCYLASSATVNWSDDQVNQQALKQYNIILNEPGFLPFKEAIIMGNASLIPKRVLTLTPTLDELYLALAFRVSAELEIVDTVHQKSEQTDYKLKAAKSLEEMFMVSDNETGLTDATKSKEHNFSTTLPVFSRGGSSVDPVAVEDIMKIMRLPLGTTVKALPEHNVTLNMLNDFIGLARHRGIVLPTKECLEKRYSLTARSGLNHNEHNSFEFNQDENAYATALKEAIRTGSSVLPMKSYVLTTEKGYEHKLCIFIPYNGTEAQYARHLAALTAVDFNKYHFENTMRGTSINSHAAIVGRHLHDEFKHASSLWNKCVIVPKQRGNHDIGFFQWRIDNLGGVNHLVINIWNLISRLEGSMGTVEGGIFVSTTSETLHMCELLGLHYVTGIDLTCVVPGMTTAGWVVLDKDSWEEAVHEIDSQLAHVHFITTKRTREQVRGHDIRRNIILQLETFDKLLKMVNSTQRVDAVVSNIADATLKKTKHGVNYFHDEMHTMYYFFKGITVGTETDYIQTTIPHRILNEIFEHLAEIIIFLSSGHLGQHNIDVYKNHLRAIVILIKDYRITSDSFKINYDETEVDNYIDSVKQYIRLPSSRKTLSQSENLKEFETQMKLSGVSRESRQKLMRQITASKGGKQNKTRKRYHHQRSIARRARRNMKRRMHTRRKK